MKGVVKTGLLPGGRGIHGIIVFKDCIENWEFLVVSALRFVGECVITVSREKFDECNNFVRKFRERFQYCETDEAT
jgi:hypothetical protein